MLTWTTQAENEEFELEGYENLEQPGSYASDEDDNDDMDDDDDDEPLEHKTRHAFFDRSVRMAEKAALRTQFEEDNSFTLNEDDDIITRPTSRDPGSFGRRNRQTGSTLPAYHKKVSHELDSDDELMVTMRDKGYTDQQIADRLAREGRCRYDRKSIGTRIGCIKLAQAAHIDRLLEEGYKVWEFEDDQLLMKAYELADIEVRYDIERIRAWRFRKVSEQMRRLSKDALFSAKACQERYRAIMNGTAGIPTDLDDDPDARRQELEKHRVARQLAREADEAQKEKKAEIKHRIKEEARLRNTQKAEQTALKRAEKTQEKADRAMRRAAQHQMRLQRAQENKQNKLSRLEEIKAQKVAQAQAAKDALGVNPHSPLKVNRVLDFKAVTPETPDPRIYLSFSDLKTLCKDRLQDADDVYTLMQLKATCRSKGLSTAGTKIQMRYQLALNEARKYPSFEKNLAREIEGIARPEDEESGEQIESIEKDYVILV
ncbi:hypothetical protein GQ43DRAFT_363423 [Delitschia confertaspora ATCC 74209]|uniref:DUF7626 domain-containing protein n=1 Tax=Delitschia confertaspora ATCC 74209 TaxID=1513339 RepID=A0A9P4MWB9_9PLEO|nr:hypothetical protein GQ43DRAFT_363423 [Delitschia confertaspora ATCC 74209]